MKYTCVPPVPVWGWPAPAASSGAADFIFVLLPEGSTVLRALPWRHRPFAKFHGIVDGYADDGQHDEHGEDELDLARARAAKQPVAQSLVGTDELRDDCRRRRDRRRRLDSREN